MKRLWWIVAAMLLFACGDGDGATKNGSTTNSGANADTGLEGWVATLEGDEAVFELEDLEGSTLDASLVGQTVQLNGLGGDAGSLLVRVPVGDAFEAGDYGPELFSLDWEAHDYSCVGGLESVTVTFTSTDPARGSYSGTLTCNPAMVTPDSAFEVTLAGEFGENL